MEYLIKQVTFRAFSYEIDPDFVVDMQRCREVLEGGWFDDPETCRMNHKIVLRAKGTSWVNSVARTIISYSDLVGDTGGDAWLTQMRFHPNLRHPKLVFGFLENLKKEARKREFQRLFVFADQQELCDDLSAIRIPIERQFQWISTNDVESDDQSKLVVNKSDFFFEGLSDFSMIPYMGPFLPPKLILSRSFMAASYGFISHQKPIFLEIKSENNLYFACFDGREWFVFRKEKTPEDLKAIKNVISALGESRPSKILLSTKAIEKTGLIPCSEKRYTLFSLPI
ncbi:MAG: hypothetical protein HQM08_26065 [Candidatus Riflebacteria bacterium]|nr:hypothetical protein [Candidatus Riflebacteria bacterium]